MKKITYLLFTILLCFICLNNVKASATCVYEPSYTAPYQYSITCKSNSNGNANCTIKDSYNQLSIASDAVKFSIENSCPNTIYISFEQNTIITNINTTSGEAVSLNKSKSSEGTTTPNNPTNPSNPTEPTNPPTANDKTTIDLENFCQGPVQGAFTTLGWVFFILKILIPILIVVFGSIDVGKAVIASKDDEIKKSIKSLAFRIIAGFIIFFVPTILNFAVKMIDNSDVYNGTFWDCTKCMLDPINNVCSTLRGEN